MKFSTSDEIFAWLGEKSGRSPTPLVTTRAVLVRLATMAPGIFENLDGLIPPTSSDYEGFFTHGVVVPDTNVLLNLYRYNTLARADLLKALALVGERLWAPHQVLYEFWENREEALKDPERARGQVIEDLGKDAKQLLKSLRTWTNRVALEEEKVIGIEQALLRGVEQAKEAISQIVDAELGVHSLDPDADPVVLQLKNLLDGKVGKPLRDEALQKAQDEAARRLKEKLPPGYRDTNKGGEEAHGDYLVWEQTLQELAIRKRDLVLITGDAKEDWWRKKQGRFLGPRLELAREFQERTGKKLLMIRPDAFLKKAGEVLKFEVSDASVHDVQRVDRSAGLSENGGWDLPGLTQLLDQLSEESPVQHEAIFLASRQGGFISRAEIYELGNYPEDRTLRGFTRPIRRIASELKARGMVRPGAIDILETFYNPDESYVQAAGFTIPQEVLPMVLKVLN